MSDKALPKCPYCGADMILDGLGMVYCYECENCGASAPWDDTPDKAYEKAFLRPLQKPLTVEQGLARLNDGDPVWIEERFGEGGWDIPFGLNCISLSAEEKMLFGKEWRCWATKPTDEERAAAKWEEADHATD